MQHPVQQSHFSHLQQQVLASQQSLEQFLQQSQAQVQSLVATTVGAGQQLVFFVQGIFEVLDNFIYFLDYLVVLIIWNRYSI